jgi:hypothetical protein
MTVTTLTNEVVPSPPPLIIYPPRQRINKDWQPRHITDKHISEEQK